MFYCCLLLFGAFCVGISVSTTDGVKATELEDKNRFDVILQQGCPTYRVPTVETFTLGNRD